MLLNSTILAMDHCLAESIMEATVQWSQKAAVEAESLSLLMFLLVEDLLTTAAVQWRRKAAVEAATAVALLVGDLVFSVLQVEIGAATIWQGREPVQLLLAMRLQVPLLQVAWQGREPVQLLLVRRSQVPLLQVASSWGVGLLDS